MPHVVTDNCNRCLFTDCVEHCPVQAFHADDERSYIDPDTCIDCGLCVDECPVTAIFPQEDLPAEWSSYIEKNTAYFKK